MPSVDPARGRRGRSDGESRIGDHLGRPHTGEADLLCGPRSLGLTDQPVVELRVEQHHRTVRSPFCGPSFAPTRRTAVNRRSRHRIQGVGPVLSAASPGDVRVGSRCTWRGQNQLVASASDLVSGFWESYRLSSSAISADRLSAREFAWAAAEVDDRVQDDPSEVFDLLIALADAAPDDAALAYLGAGPIEDLLVHHGSDVVFDRVEGWARCNEHFRKALRCAWFDADLPQPVVARLRRFGDSY